MGRIENLKPKDSNQNREEAKINGKKGGIASGKVRRERKKLREDLEWLLSQEASNGKTYQENITLGLLKSALTNPRAYEVIRDTVGEKPIEQIQNLNPPIINIKRPNIKRSKK